jgi:DNA-binding GntR family transcriptional regulator
LIKDNIPRLHKVAKTTLKSRNYEAIRKAIICGRFQAGETLTIRDLSEALGTSTTPVREALQQLVAEKVLTTVANKEFRVPLVSRETLNEIYNVRMLLEGYASYRAAKLATDEQVETINKLHAELKKLRRSKNTEGMLLKNMDWHFSIYAISAEQYLTDLIQNVWLSVGPIFASPYLASNKDRNAYCDIMESNEKALIEHIQTGDAESAKTALIDTLAKSSEWFNLHYPFDLSHKS